MPVSAICIPGNATAASWLSERASGSMRPGSVLVNVARGSLIDEPALLRALERGVPEAAILDVFDTEPLPDGHPLRTAPRTLLTPHVGYVTAGTYRVFYSGAVEAIRAFLDGQPIRLLGP